MSHISRIIAAPTPSALNKGQLSLLSECMWSVNLPELQKACYLNRVCQFEKPRSCQYNEVASILQKGPSCGLTALSMLLQEHIRSATPEYLLHLAKHCCYTYNGEMFSVQYLQELACKQLEAEKMDEVRCELHKGKLSCENIKEALFASACLLVPYPFEKQILIT